jgi:hypothetical protein
MKTPKKKNEATAPANVRPSKSVSKTKPVPRINFALRYANRALPTENLLSLLRTQAPDFYKLAEVIGKWVWIQFTEKQPSEITRALSELGFHWNNTRQAWQHPCGSVPVEAATYDPRRRYGSYFAADVQPA